MTRAALASLLALLLAPAALAQEPLRWAFAPGAKWRLEVVQKQDTLLEMNGATRALAKSQRHVVAIEVKEQLEQGEWRVAATVERVVIEEQRPDGTLRSVDTDAPGAGGQESGIVKKPIVCRVTARGELRSVEAFGDAALAQMAPEERELLTNALGEGMLLNLALGLVSPLPEGPAPVGTTWKSGMLAPLPTGTIRLEIANRVVSVDGDRTTIEQEGTSASEALKGATSEMKQQVVLERGMVLSSTGTFRMEFEGNGRKVTSTSTTERKRLEPPK